MHPITALVLFNTMEDASNVSLQLAFNPFYRTLPKGDTTKDLSALMLLCLVHI